MAVAEVRGEHAHAPPPAHMGGGRSAMAERKAKRTNHATLRDKGKDKGGSRWRRVEPRMAEVRGRGLLTPPLDVGQVQRKWPKQGARSGDPPTEVGQGQRE